jgi:predicted ATPase
MKTKPKLKTIQAKGYRNLEMATPFQLDNLNILIGANGAGKSNLLEMIEFLPDALSNGLTETFKKRRGFSSVINLDRELPSEMQLEWKLSGSSHLTQGIDLKYQLIIEGDNHGRFEVTQEILNFAAPRSPNELTSYKHLDFKYGDGTVMPSNGAQNVPENLKSAQKLALGTLSSPQVYPVLESVRDQALSWRFYNANDMNVHAIKRESKEIDALQKTLAPDGCNLGMVLYNLIQSEEGDFGENLDRILRSLYNGHRSIRFPLVDSMHFELSWQFDNPRKPLKLDQMSDGTIRMLCWIAVLADPNPPALVCIDEPELGIHPAWLPILATLISEAAEHTQVIISTHSSILLDEFSLQADKVIVWDGNNWGQSKIKLQYAFSRRIFSTRSTTSPYHQHFFKPLIFQHTNARPSPQTRANSTISPHISPPPPPSQVGWDGILSVCATKNVTQPNNHKLGYVITQHSICLPNLPGYLV